MLPELGWMPRLAAGLLALGLITLFVVRAMRKDRRDFARFRRYRSTARRQAVMRRWLLESFILFGGSATLVLLLVYPIVGPLLAETQALPGVAWVRDALGSDVGGGLGAGIGGLGMWLLVGGVVGVGILTVIGARNARREGGVIMLGNIAALLPRNRP
jgi:hypothetical protein